MIKNFKKRNIINIFPNIEYSLFKYFIIILIFNNKTLNLLLKLI
jgi:hypothetical protein